MSAVVGSQGEQRPKTEEEYDGENGQETGKEKTLEGGEQNKEKKGEIETGRMVWWVRTPAVLSCCHGYLHLSFYTDFMSSRKRDPQRRNCLYHVGLFVNGAFSGLLIDIGGGTMISWVVPCLGWWAWAV